MPTGVYYRSPKLMKEVRKNLAKGKEPASIEKQKQTMKLKAQNPEWIQRVSLGTRKAMRRPDVRKRHLIGLKKAFEKHGNTFQGGNGKPPVLAVRRMARKLEPLGYIREYVINTCKYAQLMNAPHHYKVDFGNPKNKVAVELDGPCHRNIQQQIKDKKKTAVLELLGWDVVRIKHE